MKKFKKILLPIILTIISGVIINWLTPIDIPGAIWKAITWFMHLFLLKICFSVWGIILLMLIIPFLIGLFNLLFRSNSVENYLSDTFFGVLWDWRYRYIRGKKYTEEIIARCPHCKTILKPSRESSYPFGYTNNLVCTHCEFCKKFDFGYDELLDRVKKEIDRKIITGEYKKIAQQAD
jgi:hypothetical protein